MNNVQMKQGDLHPKITATLTVGNPAVPVDLTGCTVQLRYGLPYLGLVFTKTAAVVGLATNGNVEYQWVLTDTDVPGNYDAEWVVTLPDTTVLTVPNGFAFGLQIVPKVGNLTFALSHGSQTTQKQTQTLVRRLRTRLADTQRLLYTEDGHLAQALLDGFESFVAEIEGTQVLFDSTDVGYDADDPLLTDIPLTRREQDIWMLIAARELLEIEVLEASRIAANLRTPAGQQTLTEVYKALREALRDVETALDRKLLEGAAQMVFGDLTVIEAGRFTDDTGQ